jgi:hypothetical protein
MEIPQSTVDKTGSNYEPAVIAQQVRRGQITGERRAIYSAKKSPGIEPGLDRHIAITARR